MSELVIADDVVWAKHIEDPTLRNRVQHLIAGEQIHLLIDGIVGKWEKMKDGKHGVPTPGIKPVGAMAEIWKSHFRPKKGKRVAICEVTTADSYFEGLTANLAEWDSPQDERAYHDLQPR